MSDIVFLASYPSFTDYDKNFKCDEGRYVWHLWLTAKGNPNVKVEFLYDDYRSFKMNRHRLTDILSRNKPKVIVAFGQSVVDVLDIEGKVGKIRGSVYKKQFGRNSIFVIPTYDFRGLKKPDRMFAEESIEKGVYTAYDLARANKILNEGWTFPKENFNLDPTVDEVEQFVEDAIREQWLLGTDIESDGLDTQIVPIVVIGFARNEEDCIVVPILTQNGKEYWSRKDWPRIQRALNRLFKYGKFMFQNGVGYDVPLIINRGWNFKLENFVEDTMVMHHTLHAESEHNIGFISSIYGKQPNWKASYKTYLGKLIYKFPDIPGQTCDESQQGMRLYNARDCVALHQIRNGMMEEIAETIEDIPEFQSFWFVYKKSMRESRAVVTMQNNGILLDKPALKEWNKFLEAEIISLLAKLRERHKLPEDFSFTSSSHKAFWVYGIPIEKLKIDKINKALAYYDHEVYNYQYECSKCGRKKVKKFYPDLEEVPRNLNLQCSGKGSCGETRVQRRTDKEPTLLKGKSKDTNAYRDLMFDYEIASIKVLPQLKQFKPLMGDGDKPKPKLNKKAITRHQIAINNRLDEISNLKCMNRDENSRKETEKGKIKREEIEKEQSGLIDLRETLTLLNEFNAMEKLRSSFSSFKVGPDGRVRANFMVTGTSTGRLACNKPNLMNIPAGKMGKKVRGCFKAEKGKTLISIDYSGLEVWIGAYVMEDYVLQKVLQEGVNFHDFNTKVFFGLEEDDPKWSDYRKVAKMIVFGRILFGGTDNGIYNNVITALPECGLTLKQFKTAVENYMKAHPEYADWCRKVERIALNQRISENGIGRIRQLMGNDISVMRQALNSPTQGTAADVAREAMADAQELIDEKSLTDPRWKEVKQILFIHDELVFEAPVGMRQEVTREMAKVMTKQIIINGHKLNLKVDPEVGIRWGNQDPYDYKTDKIEKGSKH